MEIRKVKREDIEIIWNWGESNNMLLSSPDTISFWPKEILFDSVNSEEVDFFVATDLNEIIGFILVNLNKTLKTAIVENLFVLEPYRNFGVGSNLLKEIIVSAQNKNIGNICSCTPDLDIVEFGKKLGFEEGKVIKYMNLISSDIFRKED